MGCGASAIFRKGDEAMAYRAFAEHDGPHLPEQTLVSIAAPAAPEAGFSPVEWRIVAMAQHDSRASIEPESRLRRLARQMFGFPGYDVLSNERLEALRRMAVLSWHDGYTVAPSAIRAFLAAGYSLDHYEALLGRISAARYRDGAQRRAGNRPADPGW
jgi:hypothetical protein